MKTDLERFIEEETLKQKSTGFPVKASIFERLLVRKCSPQKLRPNPEDEFCFPDIGPNMGIISSYVSQFVDNMKKSLPLMDEPLYVQKIRPSGYMLLNGHHRWAAALRLSIRRVPVSIVNGVYESDIKRILELSTHEKRATLDLDEVVFADPGETEVEKRRGLPMYGIQKKHLRLGIPALLNNLRLRGYDIWVYSANYYSVDDLRKYFKRYAVSVDGIITGMKKKVSQNDRKKMDELFANKYKKTLHIDTGMIVETKARGGDFREAEINTEPKAWSASVIEALDGFESDEK